MILLFRVGRWARHHLLPQNFIGKRYLRRTYARLAARSSANSARGVPVSIGGYGPFELDPLMALGRYEEWGSGHNSGLDAWVAACRDRRVVIDIGAHIGLYSLPASRVLAEGGRIYAFEPAEQNARVLVKHVQYNAIDNVEVVRQLVGDSDRVETPFFERTDEVDGMNAIVVGKNAHLYSRQLKPQVSLDTFCSGRHVAPDVIKIDVEGAELRVLHGATRVLAEDRPVMFLSVHPGRIDAFGDSLDELASFISTAGYQARDTRGRTVDRFAFDEYVLLPAERAEKEMSRWQSAH